jgi:predicted transcriptional regulator
MSFATGSTELQAIGRAFRDSHLGDPVRVASIKGNIGYARGPHIWKIYKEYHT